MASTDIELAQEVDGASVAHLGIDECVVVILGVGVGVGVVVVVGKGVGVVVIVGKVVGVVVTLHLHLLLRWHLNFANLLHCRHA